MSTPEEPTGGWAPEVELRGGRRRLGRVALGAVALLLVMLLAVPVVLSSRIPRTPVEGLSSGGSPTNVLITGSDSREGLSREEMRELSTGTGADIVGERTDTILLLSYQGSDVAMLSFPRDLWVERCDGSTGRINVAQSLDGPGCLVDTVRALSGLEVHHYARITFGGFRDVVDAVGGVELCLDRAIADRDAGIDLPAGCQRLDGADALGFVRVRKIDDDLGRIQRQQRFLQALAREVARPSTLFNPARLWSVSNQAGGAVTLDDTLGTIDLLRLGWAGRSLAGGDVSAHTVPADPGTTAGGAEVLYPRDGEADALFARFADGSILAEDTDDEIDPATVPVTVLNGAGVSGLAARIGERLEERGYPIEDLGNAASRDRTLVEHPPGERAAARAVADDLPVEPTIEERDDVTLVTVTLGTDAEDS
ncbi:MAG: LCP family protein [Nitriliruptoraceae bacterium]